MVTGQLGGGLRVGDGASRRDELGTDLVVARQTSLVLSRSRLRHTNLLGVDDGADLCVPKQDGCGQRAKEGSLGSSVGLPLRTSASPSHLDQSQSSSTHNRAPPPLKSRRGHARLLVGVGLWLDQASDGRRTWARMRRVRNMGKQGVSSDSSSPLDRHSASDQS